MPSIQASPTPRNEHLDGQQPVNELILAALADGAVFVGSMTLLSHTMGVKVAELRASLRELLEARQIAVTTEACGRLTIRLERRNDVSLPSLPPASERRRTMPDVWIF